MTITLFKLNYFVLKSKKKKLVLTSFGGLVQETGLDDS